MSERWDLYFNGTQTGSLVYNILVLLHTWQQIQKWFSGFICQTFLIIEFILNPKQFSQLDKSHILYCHSHHFLSLLTITCWFLTTNSPSLPTLSENNLFWIWDAKFGSCQVMTAQYKLFCNITYKSFSISRNLRFLKKIYLNQHVLMSLCQAT